MNRGTYKLVDWYDAPRTIDIVRIVNGRLAYETATLEPGELYVLEDDDKFIASLKNDRVKKPFTPTNQKKLDKVGADYEIETCKVCGGKAKKLYYKVVEVYETEV